MLRLRNIYIQNDTFKQHLYLETMKKNIITLSLLGLILTHATNCKKKDEKKDSPLPSNVPAVITSGVSDINSTSASSGGTITSDGGGEIITSGIICGTDPSPIVNSQTITSGTGNIFTTLLTGLTPNTTYYIWSFATNKAGMGMGNGLQFKTYTGTATDIDGNTYKTITIGNQVWLSENLKVTKYRNGDPIANVTEDAQWWNLKTGAYCNYHHNTSNISTYGRLYNWHAVNDSRNIAPTGYHVATDAEWQVLINKINIETNGFGIAKSLASISGWKQSSTIGQVGNNQSSNNSSGFNTVPAGYHSKDGSFYQLQEIGAFWTATEKDANYAYIEFINYSSTDVLRTNPYKEFAYPVRCIKN